MDRERLKGNLDLLLLSVLSSGPAHGYAIISALRDRSGGTFDLSEGARRGRLPGGGGRLRYRGGDQPGQDRDEVEAGARSAAFHVGLIAAVRAVRIYESRLHSGHRTSPRSLLAAALLLLSVVTVAGCTGSPGTTTRPGGNDDRRGRPQLPAASFPLSPAMPRTCSGPRTASSPCWTGGSTAAARR